MEEFPIFRKDKFWITTDPNQLDQKAVEGFLQDTFWAKRRPQAVTERALANSFCFSLFAEEMQIGFARVVTDYATFAYLCDVYLEEEYRGQGLGSWLLQCIVEHPQLQNLSWCLLTGTNHDFYQRFGFHPLRKPQHYLEKRHTW